MSRRGSQIAAVVIVAAIAASAFTLRKRFIATFFQRSAEKLRPIDLPPSKAPDVPAAARVRVLLVDGLGAGHAHSLPHLSEACAKGMDLEIDVGFPTVSLPVQTVLWTALTQQQAGVQFVAASLDPVPTGALPARVSDSIAVAELHPYLVNSFGFASAAPPGEKLVEPEKSAWLEQFETRATNAISSDRTLAFVHIGRVDVAGHKFGAHSSQYRRAAQQADDLAGSFFEARSDTGTRWFVLADHGHLAGGGHGGSEESIRVVRGCVFGAGIHPGSGRAHLVDLSRTLFASLGLLPPKGSSSRPLAEVARGHVALGSTLPSPSGARLALALTLAVAGLLATCAAARRRAGAWPWWLLVAYGSVLVIRGLPTLSNPMVYPPMGRAVYVAALPGLLVLAATIARSPLPLARLLVAQLSLPLATAAAALVACGGASALAGGPPPLFPIYSAHASVLLIMVFAGAAAALLAALARAGLSAFGRGSASGTRRRDA